MAATVRIIATAWRAVASAGSVAITPENACWWAVTQNGQAPGTVQGHPLQGRATIQMELEGAERLWVKAKSGPVWVTRDAG